MQKKMFYSRGVGNHRVLLVSFLILIVLTVFSREILYSHYWVVPLEFLVMAFSFSSSVVLSKYEMGLQRVSIAFLLIVFIYRFVGYSSIEVLELVQIFNWAIMGIIAVYIIKILSPNELNDVYFLLLFCLGLLMILFIREGRLFLIGGDDSGAVDVATAWYGSLFMLLSGLSLIVVLNVKQMFPRIVAFLVLILTLYLNVFVLQRGTIVTLTMAEIGLILIFLIKRKSLIILLSGVILIFIILSRSTENLISIFEWLAQVSPSERLSSRFEEISKVLVYENLGAASGSFAARNSLIEVSWNTFTSSAGYFLLGAGEHSGDNTIIGHHSFIIDTLARYGLVGGLLLTIYFIKQYQVFMANLDRKKEWALYMQCAIVFAFYVLRNFYGQVAYSLVNLVLLVLFPLTFQLIHYCQNKPKSRTI